MAGITHSRRVFRRRQRPFPRRGSGCWGDSPRLPVGGRTEGGRRPHGAGRPPAV